jgi:hypothetical protein
MIKYQKLLWLEDWAITRDNKLTNGNWWECDADASDKVAHISICPDIKWDDRESTLIHELIHCQTAEIRDMEFIRDVVSDKTFRIIQKRIEEKEEELVQRLEVVIYNLIK